RLGRETCGGERAAKGGERPCPFRMRRRHVMRVGPGRMAEEQRAWSDAAGARVRRVLEHERGGPLAEREPPPPGVEGPARPGTERLERIEAGIGEPAEAVG